MLVHLHTAHDLFFVKYIHFEIGATAAACDPIKQEGRIEEIFPKSSKPDLKIAQTDRSDTQSHHGKNLPNSELQEAFRLTEKKKTSLHDQGKRKPEKKSNDETF